MQRRKDFEYRVADQDFPLWRDKNPRAYPLLASAGPASFDTIQAIRHYRRLGNSVYRSFGCSVTRLLGCSVTRLLGICGDWSSGRIGYSVTRWFGISVGSSSSHLFYSNDHLSVKMSLSICSLYRLLFPIGFLIRITIPGRCSGNEEILSANGVRILRRCLREWRQQTAESDREGRSRGRIFRPLWSCISQQQVLLLPARR